MYFNAFLVTLNNRTALRRADELPATTISLHIAEGRTYPRSEEIGFSQQDLEDGLVSTFPPLLVWAALNYGVAGVSNPYDDQEFTIATQPDAHVDGEEVSL